MLSVKRFTPTGVGTICIRSDRGSDTTVHPHGRGDNGLSTVSQHSVFGSPPRAWGQCHNGWGCHNTSRFTPTGVGTITARGRNTYCRAVHPHGRGDNVIHYSRQCKSYGSPPRAWGQCALVAPARYCCRFTPTGVGTIGSRCDRYCHKSVHPHGRGDNLIAAYQMSLAHGSPPRAWGQSVSGRAWRTPRRFTPTGVGTICSC